MSFVHVDIAIGSTRYKGVMKAVTIALCRHLNAKRIEANDDYEVWAGLKTLCKETGWKRTSVQTAIDKLAKDKNPFLEIKSQGVGKETTHYVLYPDRLVVCETIQGGAEDGIRVPGDGTRVVCETHPNREAESSKELSTKSLIQLDQRSKAAEDKTPSLKALKTISSQLPAKSNTAGLRPAPNQDSVRGPGVITSGKPATVVAAPSSASPHHVLAKLLLMLCPDLEENFEYRATVFTEAHMFCKKHDAFEAGLRAAWAFRKSNYWQKKLDSARSFLNAGVYAAVDRQYENYYAERKDDRRPETIHGNLENLVTFWKAITDREREEWEKKAEEYLAGDAAVLLQQSSSNSEVD